MAPASGARHPAVDPKDSTGPGRLACPPASPGLAQVLAPAPAHFLGLSSPAGIQERRTPPTAQVPGTSGPFPILVDDLRLQWISWRTDLLDQETHTLIETQPCKAIASQWARSVVT